MSEQMKEKQDKRAENKQTQIVPAPTNLTKIATNASRDWNAKNINEP